MLTVQGSGGSYTLTYVPQPLNVTAVPYAGTGSLLKGNYFYEVTANTPAGEDGRLAGGRGQRHRSSAVDLTWYPVPRATTSTAARTPVSKTRRSPPALPRRTTPNGRAAGSAATPGRLPASGRPLRRSPRMRARPPSRAVLDALSLIGGAGNTDVQQAGGVYRIHFQGTGWAARPSGCSRPDPAGLTSGANEKDILNVRESAATAADAALLTSTSLTGLDMPVPNTTQELVGRCHGRHVHADLRVTRSIPTDLKPSQATGGSLPRGHALLRRCLRSTAAGESIASNEASAVTAESGAVTLTWVRDPGGDRLHLVYREARPQGAEDTAIDTMAACPRASPQDLGSAGAAGSPPHTTSNVVQGLSPTRPWRSTGTRGAAAVQSALDEPRAPRCRPCRRGRGGPERRHVCRSASRAR